MAACLLYVCCGSDDEAKRIAHTLVLDEKLAACANMLPGMTSIYEWEGEACEEPEVLLVLKTTAALAERATQRVVELHSYDVPAVSQLPITGGNDAFLRWIEQATITPT